MFNLKPRGELENYFTRKCDIEMAEESEVLDVLLGDFVDKKKKKKKRGGRKEQLRRLAREPNPSVTSSVVSRHVEFNREFFNRMQAHYEKKKVFTFFIC